MMPPARHPFHDVVIAGAHNTPQARVVHDETSTSLTLSAILGALEDSGLRLDQVDGMNVTSGRTDGERDRWSPYDLFGGRGVWQGNALPGQEGVIEAAAAIAAGLCHTVLLADGLAGGPGPTEATAPWTRPESEFVACWGLYTAAHYALMARRHMELFGTRPEHLAEVAATIRNHGNRNPVAARYQRGETTADDVLNSRLIADPFHLLDCCMATEGAAALLLTTRERCQDLASPPIHFLGCGLEVRGPAYTRPPVWDEYGWVGERAARCAFEMAGIGPADVDVCELYDNFSWEVIHQFEAFGFCDKGEGGPFVMDGRIGLDGEFPTATDGGLLSFSHFGVGSQLQKVIAGVAQLRGRAGTRQVRKAQVALASGGGLRARTVLLFASEAP